MLLRVTQRVTDGLQVGRVIEVTDHLLVIQWREQSRPSYYVQTDTRVAAIRPYEEPLCAS